MQYMEVGYPYLVCKLLVLCTFNLGNISILTPSQDTYIIFYQLGLDLIKLVGLYCGIIDLIDLRVSSNKFFLVK